MAEFRPVSFKKDVVSLQQRMLQLKQDEAIVSIFGNEQFVPLSRAEVIVLSRGITAHNYPPLGLVKTSPGLVARLPLVWADGKINVGGSWWCREHTRYLVSYSKTKEDGFIPVGDEVDVLEHNWDRPLWSHYSLKDEFTSRKRGGVNQKKTLQHQRMVMKGLEMTDPCTLEALPGYDVNGFLSPRLPDVLFQAAGKLPLRLSEGIDRVVLDAVNFGLWRVADGDILIPGLQTPHRGVVRRTQFGYTFWPDEDPTDDEMIDIQQNSVCSAVEQRLQELFHVPVRVDLAHTLPEGDSWVAKGTMLFAPQVPSGRFETLAQLEQEAGMQVVQTLKYLAALTRARMVNGLIALDSDVAIGDEEPYLDLGTLVPKVQKLVDAPHSLRLKKGIWNIDLDDFQGRRENRLAAEKFQAQFRQRLSEKGKQKLVSA